MKRDLLWAVTVIFVFLLGGIGRSGGQQKNETTPLLDERFCTDANGDGKLDVSDAVSVLSYLFQGGTTPYCIAEGGGLEDRFVTREELPSILENVAIVQTGEYAGDGTEDRAFSVPGRIRWLSVRAAPSSNPLFIGQPMVIVDTAGPDRSNPALRIEEGRFVVTNTYREDGVLLYTANNTDTQYVWTAILSPE